MNKKYITTATRKLFTNPFWKYKMDLYDIGDGQIREYHYVDSYGSVMVIPVNNNGEIIMLKQYRYLNSKYSIEFAGGGCISHLTTEENAAKEMLEETGFKGNLKLIGKFNPYKGVTNEICSVFTANNLIFEGVQPEESEHIEVISLDETKINTLILSGELWDGMTLAAWTLYLLNK